MSFKINQYERDILKGLPYLQRLIYVFALRPYMDYATGIVGIKRGISHQSISEELYIEPHPGYKSGSPSKDQIRRGLKSLEKIGAIKILSTNKKLVVHCILADKDNCNENKATTKAPPQADTVRNINSHIKTGGYKKPAKEGAAYIIEEAATPPVSGINTTPSLAREKICFISKSFQPSSAIIEKAKQHDCPTAECADELLKFISYHQSKGTKSHDWNAKFLGWLLRAKQYHKEKENVKRNHSASKQYSTNKNQSAVDRALSANQELLEREGRIIENNG